MPKKDKRRDEDEQVAKLLRDNLDERQKLKHEVIATRHTLRALDDRLEELEEEYAQLRNGFNDLEDTKARSKALYKEMITNDDKEIEKLKREIKRLENDIEKEENEMNDEEQKHNDDLQRRNDLIARERAQLIDQADSLDNEKQKVKPLEVNRHNLEKNISQLQANLEAEQKRRVRDVNDKEREKFEAVKTLNEDMQYKIQETKANLLALNDEQLQTTTKLTILQNHQLTTELDYQSKQTEKLLVKNQKMEERIVTLQREVDLHKQMETELAKRSHQCQGIIKKYTGQVKDAEEKLNSIKARKGMKVSQEEDKRKAQISENTINKLESQLETVEKKISSTQSEKEKLKSEFFNLQKQLKLSTQKYKRAGLLLTDMLDNLINNVPFMLRDDIDSLGLLQELEPQKVQLQLNKIEEVSPDSKIKVAQFLLLQLQPLLSAGNLNIGKRDMPRQDYELKESREYDNLGEVLEKVNVEMTEDSMKEKTRFPPINKKKSLI